jgi:ribosomal protein L18E
LKELTKNIRKLEKDVFNKQVNLWKEIELEAKKRTEKEVKIYFYKKYFNK